MRVFLFFLFTIIIVPISAQTSNKLELSDVFDLEYVSDPQISPDGEKIIYVRNFKDIMTDQNLSNLWIINFDGTQNRPLTTGNQNDFSPRWSHDGEKIIYKSNKDDQMHIYLRWMDTGNETILTKTLKSPSAFSWSPGDEFIAFSMFVDEKGPSIIDLPKKPEGAKWNEPPTYIDKLHYRSDGSGYLKSGYQQLFTIPLSGGTPRQITSDPYDHGAPQWSGNGQSLIFSANLRDDADYDPLNSEIYKVDLKNGEIVSLTDRHGPDRSPRVSPDGNKIAYLGFDEQYKGYQTRRLYVMNVDGSNPKVISNDFDRNVNNVFWKKDGKGFYFQYDDNGVTKLASMNLSGDVKDISSGLGGLSLGRPYNAGTYSVSSNGRYAYTLGTTSHPADLGAGSSGENTRLTRLNDDLFAYKMLGDVEEIRYKSSYDDREIQGWIVKPPDFDPTKKYPFILEIHGGPFASYGAVFSTEIQLYAASGYVVLYTNPRGSTGYGDEFANQIDHNYPSQDYDDLMSGVDAVIGKGYIDESNLFVTGGSGGGVLSAWIVGKTNRFKAAVVAKPVINWYSMLLSTDIGMYVVKYWFNDLPWENPEAYLKYSPISLVGNVTTPTMVLVGEKDYRTPISEAEQFYAALKIRKVESALVIIPGSSHGIAYKPSNLVGKVAAILAWFDKYKGD